MHQRSFDQERAQALNPSVAIVFTSMKARLYRGIHCRISSQNLFHPYSYSFYTVLIDTWQTNRDQDLILSLTSIFCRARIWLRQHKIQSIINISNKNKSLNQLPERRIWQELGPLSWSLRILWKLQFIQKAKINK
jgi:hypothetical protein